MSAVTQCKALKLQEHVSCAAIIAGRPANAVHPAWCPHCLKEAPSLVMVFAVLDLSLLTT